MYPFAVAAENWNSSLYVLLFPSSNCLLSVSLLLRISETNELFRVETYQYIIAFKMVIRTVFEVLCKMAWVTEKIWYLMHQSYLRTFTLQSIFVWTRNRKLQLRAVVSGMRMKIPKHFFCPADSGNAATIGSCRCNRQEESNYDRTTW